MNKITPTPISPRFIEVAERSGVAWLQRRNVGVVKRSWRAICKAAAITGLRIRDLRHSFASQLASGGASLPLIGALLGHASPATTARYAHLFRDPQRAAAEKVGAMITAAGKPAKKQRGG